MQPVITRFDVPSSASARHFSHHAIDDIASHLNPLLADVFALYLKSRRAGSQLSAAHFADAHRLLGEQSEQLADLADSLAGRVRAIGGATVHSASDIARLQRLAGEQPAAVPPRQLPCLAALRADNLRLAAFMLSAQATCERHVDVATACLLESWIGDAQRRAWSLAQANRPSLSRDDTPRERRVPSVCPLPANSRSGFR